MRVAKIHLSRQVYSKLKKTSINEREELIVRALITYLEKKIFSLERVLNDEKEEKSKSLNAKLKSANSKVHFFKSERSEEAFYKALGFIESIEREIIKC